MAIGAVLRLPGFITVPRMLEFKTIRAFLDRCTRPLLNDGMAKGAFAGYDRSLGRLVFIIMATETSLGDHMPDIIRVHVPAEFHFGEEILLIQNDDTSYSPFDLGLMLGVIRGLFLAVIIDQALMYFLNRLA